jgi:hypothetical protein
MATSTHTRPTWVGHRDRTARGAGGRLSTGLAAVYRRRRPTATPLYPIVQHHLETFLARAAEADPWGEGVAGWVEEASGPSSAATSWPTASPASGVTTAPPSASWPSRARGAASARSVMPDAWWRSPLVSMTTSCRRLPVCQWVLSVPKRIRPLFHHDTAVAGAVSRSCSAPPAPRCAAAAPALDPTPGSAPSPFALSELCA